MASHQRDRQPCGRGRLGDTVSGEINVTLEMVDDIAKRAAYLGAAGKNQVDRYEILQLCFLARNSIIMDQQLRDLMAAAEDSLKMCQQAAEGLSDVKAETVGYRRWMKRMEASMVQRQDWVDTAKRNANLTARILAGYTTLMDLVRAFVKESPMIVGAKPRQIFRELVAFQEANRPDVGESEP